MTSACRRDRAPEEVGALVPAVTVGCRALGFILVLIQHPNSPGDEPKLAVIILLNMYSMNLATHFAFVSRSSLKATKRSYVPQTGGFGPGRLRATT